MLGRNKLILVQSAPAVAKPRDERFTEKGRAFDDLDFSDRPRRCDDAVSATGNEIMGLFERLRIPFPIKAEQILRLNENKDFSYSEAQRDFEFGPLSFEEGIRRECIT